MKYMKRTNIYKSNKGNNTFNPQTGDAFSYGWWRFVARIDGLVVFNNFRYSTTTSKHQLKVQRLLAQLGVRIDVTAPFPDGIPAMSTRAELVQLAEEMICDDFLRAEAKRDERNAKARQRRQAKRQTADAQFIANLESITFADIEAYRAGKLQLVK